MYMYYYKKNTIRYTLKIYLNPYKKLMNIHIHEANIQTDHRVGLGIECYLCTCIPFIVKVFHLSLSWFVGDIHQIEFHLSTCRPFFYFHTSLFVYKLNMINQGNTEAILPFQIPAQLNSHRLKSYDCLGEKLIVTSRFFNKMIKCQQCQNLHSRHVSSAITCL